MNNSVIPRPTAIHAAARALISAVTERATQTPAQAAAAAFYPGHPLGSVEAIEAEITRRRNAARQTMPLAA